MARKWFLSPSMSCSLYVNLECAALIQSHQATSSACRFKQLTLLSLMSTSLLLMHKLAASNSCNDASINLYSTNIDQRDIVLLLCAASQRSSSAGINQFGTYLDGRSVVSRISQPNSFGLLLVAFIMFLWLFYR